MQAPPEAINHLKTLNLVFARYAFCITKCFWSEEISPWNPQIHPSGAKNTPKCQSDVTMFHFDVTFSQKWCDIASLWCDIFDTIFESDVTMLHFDVTFFQKWCDISADKPPYIFKTIKFFIIIWTTKKSQAAIDMFPLKPETYQNTTWHFVVYSMIANKFYSITNAYSITYPEYVIIPNDF